MKKYKDKSQKELRALQEKDGWIYPSNVPECVTLCIGDPLLKRRGVFK